MIQKKWLLFFTLLIIFFVGILAKKTLPITHSLESISPDLNPKKEWIEKFFQRLFLDSEVGYVLFGNKPISVNCYLVDNSNLRSHHHHIVDTLVVQGAQLWEKIQNAISPNINYAIIVSESYKIDDKKYIQILAINKKVFLKTIEDNLRLFQYVLGPSVTSESLLKAVLDPTQNLHSILNNNKTLIGIVLGFGTNNSLFGSRLEVLQEGIFVPIKVPFKPNSQLSSAFTKEQLLFLDFDETQAQYFKQEALQASWGYKSIEEEYAALQGKLCVDTSILQTYSPYFFYFRLKNDLENLALFQRLVKEQGDIIEVINSEDFLEKTLDKLGVSLNQLPLPEKCVSNDQIPGIVAQNLVSELIQEALNSKQYIEIFISGLMEGWERCTNPIVLENHYFEAFSLYEKFKKLQQLNNKLDQINDLFDQYDKENLISIIPKKLYYTIQRPGRGGAINNYNQKLLVHYRICTLNESKVFCETRVEKPEWLILSDTILGLHLGIQGMQKNEIRTLYIHPDLAYGIYTTGIEKGIGLKITLELLDIDESYISTFEVDLKDFQEKTPKLIEADYTQAKKTYAYYKGVLIGYHYKHLSHLFSLKDLITEIKQVSENAPMSSTLDCNAIINYLHWIIYKNQEAQEEKIASKAFQEFELDPKLIPVERNYIYYKQKFKGLGNHQVENNSIILLHYRIQDNEGNVLEDTFDEMAPREIHLARTMLGLKQGLLGRSKGERGILYIHPKRGFRSYYHEKGTGKYLTVYFELIDVL